MDWQEPLALGLVAATVVAFAWRPLRRRFGPRRFSLQRDTACGCAGGNRSGPPPPSVKISGRRGERPRIEVR